MKHLTKAGEIVTCETYDDGEANGVKIYCNGVLLLMIDEDSIGGKLTQLRAIFYSDTCADEPTEAVSIPTQKVIKKYPELSGCRDFPRLLDLLPEELDYMEKEIGEYLSSPSTDEEESVYSTVIAWHQGSMNTEDLIEEFETMR